MSQIYEFNVEMTCGGCSGAVEKVLAKCGDDIKEVRIELKDKKVFVTTDTLNADQLLEKIQKTGKQTTYVGVKSA